MSAWRGAGWGAACVALLAAAASAAQPAVTADAYGAEVVQLREGPGRDLTESRCVICHSLEYIPANVPAMNGAAWQKTVQKMREKFGAPLTDAEAKQVVDYLAANYSGKP